MQAMREITDKTTSRDFLLRWSACFLALWSPLFHLWDYRERPVPVASLAESAWAFMLVSLVFAFATGARRGIRRTLIFVLLLTFFLDAVSGGLGTGTTVLAVFLLTGLCWLLRQHLAGLVTTGLAVMVLSGLLLPSGEPYQETRVSTDGAAVPTPQAQGLILHLVLDEFGSLAGLPAGAPGTDVLRDELAEFFDDYGMKVFPDAISDYTSTRNSLSAALNFKASTTPDHYYSGKRPFVLMQNAYFETLYRGGYAISVFQSTYMDFCRQSPVPIRSCTTYRYDGTDWLFSDAVSGSDKHDVLLGMYLNQPGMLEALWQLYDALRSTASAIGVTLPELLSWDGRVVPLAAVSVLPQLHAALEDAPPGSAFFAHLLLPHSPYAYAAGCRLRERPLNWLSHRPRNARSNDSVERSIRLEQYSEQARCTLSALRPIMDMLKTSPRWASTQVIMHGDHGTRLFLTEPRSENVGRFQRSDLLDGFGTLFAARHVRHGPYPREGMDRALPLSTLLRLISGAPGEPTATAGPLVYLESANSEFWSAVRWPDMTETP
jgi:hypothetical protein